MKFSDIISTEPAFLRPADAAAYLGSEQILDDARHAGWIKPRVQRPRLTLYDLVDLRALAARIRKGEMPPPEVRRTATNEAPAANDGGAA